jgi:formate/nitrite transporter FocA (FNT family)
VHNLFWVTLGNLIGGGVFVGLAYGIITRGAERQEVAPVEHAAQQP